MFVVKIKIKDKLSGKTSALCVFVLEGSEKIHGLEGDDATGARIGQSVMDMQGKFGSVAVIPTPEKPYERILLAGLGKKEKLDGDSIRFVSGKVAQKARGLKLREFSIVAPSDSVADAGLTVSQIVEGCKMSLYRFEKFKSKKENKVPDLTILVSKSEKVTRAIREAEIVSEATI